MKRAPIPVNPEHIGGTPCIYSVRASAGGVVADGMRTPAILGFHAHLEGENFHRASTLTACNSCSTVGIGV